MGKKTDIGWCDHTFNPWWGCARVSPGCERCYAETFAKRAGFGPAPADPKKFPIWGVHAERRFFGDDHWNAPRRWNAEAERLGVRRRVFCASMADVFEDRPELVDQRARLFRLIEETTRLDWLLLTKRPQDVQRLALECTWRNVWPENVWLGTTTEDQKRADERVPILLATKGPAIRFVSYEPALGPIDFTRIVAKERPGPPFAFEEVFDGLRGFCGYAEDGSEDTRGIDWLIVGGESGGRARPFAIEWADDVVAQCSAAGVPCFVKQLGSSPVGDFAPTGNFRTVDGKRQFEMAATRLRLGDRKGEDWNEWPTNLRVRQWPEVGA